MKYVIKRLDQGRGYVSTPGSASSYTRDLRRARTWPTRETAERECCGNEIVVVAEEEMP